MTRADEDEDDDDDLDDDDDDLDDDLEDDEEEDEPLTTLVERLSTFDGWEIYRVVLEGTSRTLVSIGLLPTGEGARAEYAVWRVDDEDDPSVSGVAGAEAPASDRWDDQARVACLGEILCRLDEEDEDPVFDLETVEYSFLDFED